MILVDTSVWVDHLRDGDARLSEALARGTVLSHPWVIGELALGNLRRREEVIALLRGLGRAAVADEDEVLTLITHERLYGVGIGYVDAQLLASTLLRRGTVLWTRDKRLVGAAVRLGVGLQGYA